MTPGDRMAPAGYRASSPRSIALRGFRFFRGKRRWPTEATLCKGAAVVSPYAPDSKLFGFLHH
jgi:hypothetical protein